MKFKDVKGFRPEELKKKKVELEASLFEMRMKNALGQLGSPIVLRTTRKDLARVNTALNQRKG